MEKALSNLVVLDLTRVLAGPHCTMILADFGAEVIKIEIPEKGDDTRSFAPFQNGESLYYANVNRNKKGVTLNLKLEEGKKMFLDMVKKADVVVENYRPGVMDKLGIGYDILKEVNDKIIYAAVSGFGSYGPCSQRPGYDIIAQSAGGLMAMTGAIGGEPTRAGNAMGDILGGMNLAIGILAAVNARSINGKGQRVDVSLVDSVVSSLETGVQRYFATGEDLELMGNRYAAVYPYDSFQASDGKFVIGCGNDHLFELLCKKVFFDESLLADERYCTNLVRCQNFASLKVIIEKWSTQYTIDECVEKILAAGVPAAPINTLSRLVKDPHVAGAREMFIPHEHPTIGAMHLNGNPIKLMDTMPEIVAPAPSLGQHNLEIYERFFGYNEAKMKELIENKII
ncbi:MAG: CoA transferase [Bacillota bacterium]